jgi:mono/diheme cytochrome c family protein
MRRPWAALTLSLSRKRERGVALLALVALVGSACRQDMHDQPKYKPLAKSDFFGDDRSARPLVADTVARGQLHDDDHLYTGKVGGQLATTFPFPVTADVLARGQERFDVYCTPCHGFLGRGDGMIVQRGFKQPPSFHTERLRLSPPGYYFDVISHGFGAMSDYAAQVPVRDRWAITAYIRALQLSQHATLDDVPADKRALLDQPSGEKHE